jgi:hypothetical protein
MPDELTKKEEELELLRWKQRHRVLAALFIMANVSSQSVSLPAARHSDAVAASIT